MNTEPVFVYGTLRKGGSNHFRMAGTEFIGEGKISGRMIRIDWFPALLCGGNRWVKGELYRVSEATLRALDQFEGVSPDAAEPRDYRRIKTSVSFSNGESEDAWVWEWVGNTSGAQLLEGEDWLAYEPNPS